jgi:hypothetical protein
MSGKTVFARLSSQEGQILSWVVGIFVVIAILGFLVVQCGPIIRNQINIRGLASDAADHAAVAYRDSRGNMRQVTSKVESFLTENEARLDGNITVDKDASGKEQTIRVPVRKIVNTFFFRKISYLASFTEAHAEGTSNIY